MPKQFEHFYESNAPTKAEHFERQLCGVFTGRSPIDYWAELLVEAYEERTERHDANIESVTPGHVFNYPAMSKHASEVREDMKDEVKFMGYDLDTVRLTSSRRRPRSYDFKNPTLFLVAITNGGHSVAIVENDTQAIKDAKRRYFQNGSSPMVTISLILDRRHITRGGTRWKVAPRREGNVIYTFPTSTTETQVEAAEELRKLYPGWEICGVVPYLAGSEDAPLQERYDALLHEAGEMYRCLQDYRQQMFPRVAQKPIMLKTYPITGKARIRKEEEVKPDEG